MSVWPTIVIAGLLTYAMRLSFVLLFGRMEVPVRLKQALRFVPPAVLTAIIVPELLLPTGSFDLSLGNERLLAGIVAALVAWMTKSVVVTIVVGMAVLLILQALAGQLTLQ
jgi:branched-subunit amino acid transport protein